jgi:hypothetical protein
MILNVLTFFGLLFDSASLAVAKTHQEQARRINNLMFIFFVGFC